MTFPRLSILAGHAQIMPSCVIIVFKLWQVSILHPLTCVNWRQMSQSIEGHGVSIHFVYCNKRFYFAASDGAHSCINLLYSFGTDGSQRKHDVPAKGFSFTSYRSLLVLLGGMIPSTSDPTNLVWASSDEGANWQTTVLPPMKRSRICSSVVTTGQPECLVVAGGIGSRMGSPMDNVWVDTIEVLICDQWTMVQPGMPAVVKSPRAVVHHGNYMLFTAMSDSQATVGYCCRINSLLQPQCQPEEDDSTKETEIWRQFSHPPQLCSLLSYGNDLIAVDRYATLVIRCPESGQWLKVMDHPQYLFGMSAGVLPNGDILLMAHGRIEMSANLKFFRASLSGKQAQ